MTISLQGTVKAFAYSSFVALIGVVAYCWVLCFEKGWGDDAYIRGPVATIGLIVIAALLFFYISDNWDSNPSFTIGGKKSTIPKAIVRNK